MRDDDSVVFTAAEILDLLTDLGNRLAERDEDVEAYVVGGAAIAIVLGFRRSTEDVDALFSNYRLVMEIGEEMSRERSIPSHWLNSIEPYIPTWARTEDTEAKTMSIGGLTVKFASPRWLLAMKIAAGRQKDAEDIVALIRHLELHSAEEIVNWTIEAHGEGSVLLQDSEESLTWQVEEMLYRAWGSSA